VKATSIVDGIQQQAQGNVETVHLNLLSAVGREIGAAYGIKIIPATILFDRDGKLLYKRNGFPEGEEIQQIVTG
jgi:thioredoxin-like negative regulator of GroEL